MKNPDMKISIAVNTKRTRLSSIFAKPKLEEHYYVNGMTTLLLS